MSHHQGSGGTSGIGGPVGPRKGYGLKSYRPNKYAELKPAEQQNTSGQRRVRRLAERNAAVIEEVSDERD